QLFLNSLPANLSSQLAPFPSRSRGQRATCQHTGRRTVLSSFLFLQLSPSSTTIAMGSLPPHIIESIVSYTIGRGRLLPGLRTNAKPPTVPRALFSLMGVCQEWRYAVSGFISESATLFASLPKPIYHSKYGDALPLEDIIAAGLERHVHHLQLECTPEDVANGTVYSAMDSLFTQCKGKLRNVHTVILCVSILNSHERPEIDLQEIASVKRGFCENICRVSELLREVMPNIASVVYSGDQDSKLRRRRLNTAALLALLGAVPSVEYLSLLGSRIWYADLDSELAPNVKHMHVDLCNGSSNGILELVVRNADHLETLTVDLQNSETLNRLFQNPVDRSPVVYSRLRAFKTTYEHGWRYGYSACAPRANPFPVLQQLVCKHLCPFSTSSVFYWIQPTVEVMEVNFTGLAYARFVRDGVFDSDSFPSLRHVNFSWYTDGSNLSIADPTSQLRRVLLLSLVFENVVFDTPVFSSSSAVAPLYRCKGLKELNLAGVQFTVTEAIALINKFSNLQSVVLSLKTGNDVNERGDVSDAEIKMFQEKNKQTLNLRLRVLEISKFVFTTRPRTAQHALLLASIFRSIQCIRIRSRNKKHDAEILAALEEAKQSRCFDSNGEDRIQCMEISLVNK
ncbi:hypothetical protein DL89DRAFT_299618, partial [Linderina pennispora]